MEEPAGQKLTSHPREYTLAKQDTGQAGGGGEDGPVAVQRDAISQVQHGVQDQVHAAAQGDHHHLREECGQPLHQEE